MASDPDSSRKIKTADTVFGIVETLQDLTTATVSDLAAELDLAPSTVHYHLSTLESMKYVVKGEDGYRLGLKFLDHGVFVMNQFDILEIARPILRELAEEAEETISLYVEEHGFAVGLYREQGRRGAVMDLRGKYFPMHCCAAGKAILANYPAERITEIIETRGLPAVTPNTLTERDAVLAELDRVRAEGVALSDGETMEYLRGVASPIIVNDDVLGSVSVGGYRNRLKGDYFREELPALVTGVTSEIEFQMMEHDHSKLIQ